MCAAAAHAWDRAIYRPIDRVRVLLWGGALRKGHYVRQRKRKRSRRVAKAKGNPKTVTHEKSIKKRVVGEKVEKNFYSQNEETVLPSKQTKFRASALFCFREGCAFSCVSKVRAGEIGLVFFCRFENSSLFFDNRTIQNITTIAKGKCQVAEGGGNACSCAHTYTH